MVVSSVCYIITLGKCVSTYLVQAVVIKVLHQQYCHESKVLHRGGNSRRC